MFRRVTKWYIIHFEIWRERVQMEWERHRQKREEKKTRAKHIFVIRKYERISCYLQFQCCYNVYVMTLWVWAHESAKSIHVHLFCRIVFVRLGTIPNVCCVYSNCYLLWNTHSSVSRLSLISLDDSHFPKNNLLNPSHSFSLFSKRTLIQFWIVSLNSHLNIREKYQHTHEFYAFKCYKYSIRNYLEPEKNTHTTFHSICFIFVKYEHEQCLRCDIEIYFNPNIFQLDKMCTQ